MTSVSALWRALSLNVTSHSRHPGGVQSLFCDGHVQFVRDTIQLEVWQGFRSRSGGEALGAF
ncbi:DUF1559 domain-containing protein [Blastopirellula sp. JC732]|uniref:DUF1559 domain-containing protein n=1 Tax=Blastopirellula sediminis TaxID=2894196 RepID=A0A9X1ML75_9BACT|nr:H-X9-DG-CTERM domain-containing protein [Blastopirellula sediminis]MCC9608943.1 DUF1559 domain-containing protein [Blastopirellula sediminis]MCC9628280.1 DUF1559 domain-containing protein [Blastopirellula sediminis]